MDFDIYIDGFENVMLIDFVFIKFGSSYKFATLYTIYECYSKNMSVQSGLPNFSDCEFCCLHFVGITVNSF